MADSTPISQLVNNLPAKNMTTLVLQGLDFVVPGAWTNNTNFEAIVRTVSGETDGARIREISERADQIYADESRGFQRAMWLYRTVDKTDAALGAAALANRMGEKIGFLSFLNKLTPKPDTAQTIDLAMKLAVELYAFCILNGISTENIRDFPSYLSKYSGESLMRIAALVCLDGLIPLGPDFTRLASKTLENIKSGDLQQNATFKAMGSVLPGGDAAGQLNFIQQTFGSAQGWLDDFMRSRNLTIEKVTHNLNQFIDVADDKLDYLAAFLDMSTNYFEHTGTQTVAVRVIEQAIK